MWNSRFKSSAIVQTDGRVRGGLVTDASGARVLIDFTRVLSDPRSGPKGCNVTIDI